MLNRVRNEELNSLTVGVELEPVRKVPVDTGADALTVEPLELFILWSKFVKDFNDGRNNYVFYRNLSARRLDVEWHI